MCAEVISSHVRTTALSNGTQTHDLMADRDVVFAWFIEGTALH